MVEETVAGPLLLVVVGLVQLVVVVVVAASLVFAVYCENFWEWWCPVLVPGRQLSPAVLLHGEPMSVVWQA